jgi:phage gp37-like protein
MSGDIHAAREAIVAAVDAALPELRTCQSHGGRFDRGELQRLSRRAPAVLVAVLGIPGLDDGAGAGRAAVRWGAYVLTRDTPAVRRDVAVLDYAEALMRLVRGNRWALGSAQRPRRIGADNLYSGELDKHGIALWAVTWEQEIAFAPRDLADLADWTLYSATHQVGGADDPDAEDRVELPQ